MPACGRMTGGGCSIVINVIAMTVLHERNPTYVVPAFRRDPYAVCFRFGTGADAFCYN
jgi:hypothetical protein